MISGVQILDKNQVLQKTKRMAYEILERNHTEEELIFVGVYEKGHKFAELLIEEFKKISTIKTSLVGLTLDKKSPLQSEIAIEGDLEALKHKTIILVDDVLNTGRTLAYSLKPFLNIEIKKLETAVVVDRNHSDFPLKADYIGYALSTTLQEHIHVELFDDAQFGVYLS